MLTCHFCTIADTIQHGPIKVLINPGVSESQLLFLLKGYANTLGVLRTTTLSEDKFCNLKYFLSDFCDEESIQQCSTVCDVINLLKEHLKIHPFNIYTLNVSCKHFCSSKVKTSLQQYRQQLEKFFSNTSIKDIKESLKTQLLDNSEVESVTLKLDEHWMYNTLKALDHLVYHFVGNFRKALVLYETRQDLPRCVCITWIVPTSMVRSLRAIVKAKQLSTEYLASRGVLEFVIGLRIAPSEGLYMICGL